MLKTLKEEGRSVLQDKNKEWGGDITFLPRLKRRGRVRRYVADVYS